MSGNIGCRPQAGQKHSLTHPLQSLSLRKTWAKVNQKSGAEGFKAIWKSGCRSYSFRFTAALRRGLDDPPGRGYSVPIFGTRLATFAIPVAPPTQATFPVPCTFLSIHVAATRPAYRVSNKAGDKPAFPDGG